MKKEFYILIVFLVFLFAVNYNFLDSKLQDFLLAESVEVGRIVDGDTIETVDKETIRLLGINTPERGERYYSEAKEFLEDEILRKSVRLEFVGERQDKYYRTLAYIFFNNENVNVKLVENGFANYYFYSGRDKYSDDLEKAWDKCIEDEINLCEKSEGKCSSCIEIESKSLINNCGFSCDINNWEIKVEGRNKIVFEGNLNPNEKMKFDLDLANSGGNLFLRDSEGKLVLWKSY
jgi:endonuclease YncB( thermonuclease family)